jgi:hypothetical protein
MEINGRFWGSLQLAISSGVDFPSLSMDYYLNKKPYSLLSEYIVGHKLKWFCGILDHLIIRMKNTATNASNLPTRWQVAKELLVAGDEHTSFDVYDPEDKKPFFSECRSYLKNVLSRNE